MKLLIIITNKYMDAQHYTKLKQIVNPITGTVLTKDMSLEQMSSEKSIINVKRRELVAVEEKIDEWLSESIEMAFMRGESEFMGFWKIQKGALRFSEKLFLSKASKADVAKYLATKQVMEGLIDDRKYMQAGKPSIRYPKL